MQKKSILNTANNSFAYELQANGSFMRLQDAIGDANVEDGIFTPSQMTGSKNLDASLLRSRLNESEYINVESANVTLQNIAEMTMNAGDAIAEVSDED